MNSKIIFLGRLHWWYRWQPIRFAIKALWMAVRGYHLSVLVTNAGLGGDTWDEIVSQSPSRD